MGGGGGGGKFSKERLSSLSTVIPVALAGFRVVTDSTAESILLAVVVVWGSVLVDDEPLSPKVVCKEPGDEGIERVTPFPGVGRPGKKGAGKVRLGTAPG